MVKNKENNIIVRGARVNNLKNVDVEVPRNQLTVITGEESEESVDAVRYP